MDKQAIRESVTNHYSEVARKQTSCCGEELLSCDDSSLLLVPEDAATGIGYETNEISAVPEGANLGLGCGNPLSVANLKKGETVLDLGSGAGFDVFLASKRVGTKGKVFGVDMTEEMVAKAKWNAAKAGYKNVEFIKGFIEQLPLEDESVDVVISNCVINLSPDKQAAFNEAFRVLRPGGRLDVSDTLTVESLSEDIREDLELVSCCIGGAETIGNTISMMKKAGFAEITVSPKDNSKEIIASWGADETMQSKIISAYINAKKL